MLRMEYIPPSFDVLIQRTNDLIHFYINNNSERIRLIHFLETTLAFLEKLNQVELEEAEHAYSTEKLRNIGMGAFLFCILQIGSHTKSTLKKLLLDTLEIDENRYIDHQHILIYLQEFYNFLHHQPTSTDDDGLTLADDLTERKIDINGIKKETDRVIAQYLGNMHEHILTFSYTIKPTKERLRKNIQNLPHDYIIAKQKQEEQRSQSWAGFFTGEILPNKDRLFITQLGAIGSELLPFIYKDIQEDKFADPDVPDLQQTIMMGYLWFIIQSINDSYKIKCFNYSVLYELACKALHILNIDDTHSFMNKEMREICMTAFESFIKRDDVKAKIQSYGRRVYGIDNQLDNIHCKVRPVTKKLGVMNDELESENTLATTRQYPAAIRLSELMSLAADPLCPLTCGTGAFLGYMASKTIEATAVTALVSNTLNAVGALLPDASGAVLTYVGIPFAANFIVETGAVVGFALMTHALTKTVLSLTGGLIGALVIDIPANEIKACYELIKKRLSDSKALEVDYHFINSLKKFPKECFSQYPQDWDRLQLIPTETLTHHIDRVKSLRNSLDEEENTELNIRDIAYLETDLADKNQRYVSNIENEEEISVMRMSAH